jgi:hypothetical protein
MWDRMITLDIVEYNYAKRDMAFSNWKLMRFVMKIEVMLFIKQITNSYKNVMFTLKLNQMPMVFKNESLWFLKINIRGYRRGLIT